MGRNKKGSPEYRVWLSMIQRCTNPKRECYPRYGGKGITVCERWRSGFAPFLEDMGPRPVGTTLDRIDNAGNYEPGNCRWATPLQQAANSSRTILFKVGIEVVSRRQLAKLHGVSYWSLRGLLERGFRVEDALRMATPPGTVKPRLVTYQGETLLITEWAHRIGCNPESLRERLGRGGWSVEDALTTPFTIGGRRPK